MIVGVLALQGCIDQHIWHLKQCSVETVKVRSKSELDTIDRLILPGGESSTMLNLLQRTGLWEDLKEFTREKPCWGVCAGSILLAQQVLSPQQDCLAAMPIRAHRNYYGSQLESFNAEIEISGLNNAGQKQSGDKTSLNVDFIRAPRLEIINKDCQVMAKYKTDPVLIRYRQTLVSSFHTELRESSELHKFFINM